MSEIKPIKNLSIIVAMTKDGAIGLNNGFPWPRLKGDLPNLKSITQGNTLVMGRNTYESIGKPLPDRTNIVLSSDNNFSAEGIEVYHSLDDALEFAQLLDKQIYIFGGSTVYKQTLDLASELLISHVKADYPADTYFPEYDTSKWAEYSRKEFEQFTFSKYTRIK